ncbi:MFS transporter [Streptomyces sp. NBC_01136]|uniref:MFS transporter n=1 Tax=unclassified Streptomyces TaxID=2593676 RepID=UPI003251D9AD|nr:MFS transporter [Streptomyces sp. NBC_01136]
MPTSIRRIAPEPGPVRILAVATLVNMVGNGFYASVSMLFFTRSLGLSAQTVGVCLTAAALLGVPSAIPVGHLGDRLGTRRVFIALQLLQAVFMAALPLVHGIGAFVVVICGVTAGQRGALAVNGALIGQVGPPEHRARTRAYLRSITNLGVSLGIALSGFALQADSQGFYSALIWANAFSFVLTAMLLLRLPDDRQGTPKPKIRGTEALRDRPYLAIAGLSGILSFQYDVIAIALPLWVVEHTAAPRWLVAVLLFLSGAMVVLCQVRAARPVVDVPSAGRITRRASIVFLASCCLFASAAGTPAVMAIVLLTLAVLVHSLGEVWFAAGTFELSYGLAQDHAHGQYQGTFNLAAGLVRTTSPVVLAQLCLTWGRPGWVTLGIMFSVTGLTVPPVARWAERRRRAEQPTRGSDHLPLG